MTEPNPAIDFAKARADFDNRHSADSEVSLASWAATYWDLLLTALEQMQEENERLLHEINGYKDALAQATPGDTPHAD